MRRIVFQRNTGPVTGRKACGAEERALAFVAGLASLASNAATTTVLRIALYIHTGIGAGL
jgi:hypothetical protein